MRNIAVKYGVIAEDWKVITDLMILKRSGLHIIDKMRYIQLMEPEFNMIYKLLGKRVMAHAEQFNLLSHDQYGSRKNIGLGA